MALSYTAWLSVLTLGVFLTAAVYGYRGSRGSVAGMLGVLVMLLMLLQTRFISYGGWQVSVHESVLVTLVLAEGCYLLSALTARSMWRLALLVQPVLGGVYALTLLASTQGSPVLFLSPLLAVHIGFALVGYGFVTMAAFAAFAVYTREAYLKAHSASGFYTRLPVLESADKGQFTALFMGALALAVALVAGAAYQYEQSGVWFVPTVKTVFTYLTFAATVALLLARRMWGTRGARAAKLVMLTYMLLIVAFMGGKLALILPQ